jgi:hypothetical protein
VIPGADFRHEGTSFKKMEEAIPDDSEAGYHNEYGGNHNAASLSGFISNLSPDQEVEARPRSIKSELKEELGYKPIPFEEIPL